MKNLLAVLNTARQPMTPEETKGICLVLPRPLVEEQQLALKAIFDDEDYRTAARHFAWMHLYAMKVGLTRDNLRMTLRLLVGTGEEREGIITGCLEATFELTVKTRAASSPEREGATLGPLKGGRHERQERALPPLRVERRQLQPGTGQPGARPAGASLLAELLANHDLPDEETQRRAPHCISAQLALVNARLRQVGRVIRGEEDAETLWAPHNAINPSPLPGDDGDVRLVSGSPPLLARLRRFTSICQLRLEVPKRTASGDNGAMPIHHFLVVLVIALAVPLESALAACQCFQETPASPEVGYLDLVPIPCTSTPSGFGWLKVPPNGNGDPNPPMYVALRSSRTFTGCHFLAYNATWPNGPSKVLLSFGSGDCNAPPSLKFDFTPPDSQRTEKLCPGTTGASGEGAFCAAAKSEAQSHAEAYAREACAAAACAGTTPSGSFTWSRCWRDTYTYPYPWYFDGTYSYTCNKTYNLCQ